MDRRGSALTSTFAGLALLASLLALVFSLLTLTAPAGTPGAAPPPPATIDLSLLITGRGAIGGPAESHLYDPQMLVVRRGDRVRLHVTNASHFRHAIEIVGYGVATPPLTGGTQAGATLEFVADKPGVFEYRCILPYDPATATCAPDHDTMIGHLVVIDPGPR